MIRESVYVCTYGSGDGERVAHVRAWDDREAAELFATEIELDEDAGDVCSSDIRVRPVADGAAGGAD
jgi:hypothetical protein